MAEPVMALGKIVRGKVMLDETASRLVVPYRDNAELIEHVARLGYLDGTVLDATYGEGTFWKNFKPDTLVTNDLYKPADHAWDFLDLPCRDGEYDSVVYDPDYKLCVDDATEILTMRGWRDAYDVKVGDLAYSIDPETRRGVWRPVTAVNVYPLAAEELWESSGKGLDFVATGNHRWFVRSGKGVWKWKTTETLSAHDAVPTCAQWADAPETPTISDGFVELVAWYWTEGSLDKPSTYGEIAQSHVANPAHCERIAACFAAVYGDPVDRFPFTGRTSVPMWRTRDGRKNRHFIFSASIGRDLERAAPGKRVAPGFLMALTAEQRRLFIETSFAADGQNSTTLAQSDEGRTEAFALALVLDGRPVRFGDDANGRCVRVRRAAAVRPHRAGVAARTRRDVVVWCPTVEGGTWLARRSGRVYFTGNSGTPALPEMDARYGVGEDMVYRKQRLDKMSVGAIECYRVARKFLLVKCMDMVEGGKIRWQTDIVTRAIEDVGGEKVARFLLHYVPMQQPPSWKVKPADPRIKTRTFRSGTAETDAKAFAAALDLGGEAFESPQVTASNNFSTLLVFARRDYTPRRLL